VFIEVVGGVEDDLNKVSRII